MRSRHATISPYLASTSRRGSSYAAAVRILSVFCPPNTGNQRQSGVRASSGFQVLGRVGWR